MKQKVLITGASGFVGFHLIQEALKNNFEVYAAIRKSSNIDHLKAFDIHFVVFDFLNEEDIERNFQNDRYDFVIHAAGITRALTLDDYLKANFTPTLNLARASLKFGIKKFVFYSSLAALGPTNYEDPQPITENKTPNPITKYGQSKLMAEKELAKMKDLPLIILRPTAVYGPREKDLLIMFRSLNKGIEPYIGSKNQWLSFIYVTDLAWVTFKSLLSEKSHEAYNLSDGNKYERYAISNYIKLALRKRTVKFVVPMGVVKVIATFLETINRKKTPVLNREKLGELTAENWNCTIEKAKRDFDFIPQFDLEKGIKESILWYKEQHWL